MSVTTVETKKLPDFGVGLNDGSQVSLAPQATSEMKPLADTEAIVVSREARVCTDAPVVGSLAVERPFSGGGSTTIHRSKEQFPSEVWRSRHLTGGRIKQFGSPGDF